MSDRKKAADDPKKAAPGFFPALAAGDAVSFLVFAALGRAEHQTGLGLLQIIVTALPFMAAWYPVALWLRAFKPAAVASPLAAAKSIVLPWLLAWPLGLQVRALLLDRTIPFSFAAVVFATNLVLLAAWRSTYAFYLGRRAESAGGRGG